MAKLTKKEQQQYDKCLGQCTQCMLSGNCKLRIKVKEIPSVDIIASGYEWICPKCERFNTEIEWVSTVICEGVDCRAEFQTNPPKHALGK